MKGYLRNGIEHFADATGSLGVLEGADIDFPVRRVYWITGTSNKSSRGNHAHRNLHQILLVLVGSLEVVLSDGIKTESFILSAESKTYLRIYPGYWRVLQNISLDCVTLVLASEVYDEGDYIRDWDEFVVWRQTHDGR
jgi:dTDP-4-dehydrorhamnose 3,5-epimerase-like enzyme